MQDPLPPRPRTGAHPHVQLLGGSPHRLDQESRPALSQCPPNWPSKRSQEFCWLLLSLAAVTILVRCWSSRRGCDCSSDWSLDCDAAVFFLGCFTLSNFAPFYARVARAHFPFWPSLLSVFGLPSVCRSAAPFGQGPRRGKRHLAGTRLPHGWSRSARPSASNIKVAVK